MTETMSISRREFLHLGHTLAVRSGFVVVSLTKVRDGAYRLELRHPGPLGAGGLIDAVSYPDEAAARFEALRMVRVYRTGRTPQQVADRYDTVLGEAERLRFRTGPTCAALVRQLDDEAEVLRPLGLARRQYDFAQQWRARAAAYAA